ncbi:MAG: TlyA family RNA methyltransferase [Bacillota bacterium]
MKKRLDQILTDLGHFPSREKAQRAIMAGLVLVNGKRKDKPGFKTDAAACIEVMGTACPFVSRGGIKLEKALHVFSIDPAGKTAADIGASTGGFTDCLIKKGAAKVYAVDVGYGQLDWSLRNDPRVVVLEKTNARYLSPLLIPESVDLATIDVSFISLAKIWPAISGLLKPGGDIVALIKPQFEAGKNLVARGVIRDPRIHRDTLSRIIKDLQNTGWYLRGLDYSPLLGPEGNREFLSCWKREEDKFDIPSCIDDVVERAYAEL